MKYEDIIKITNEPEVILRYIFPEVDDDTFARIKVIIMKNKFLSNYTDKLYVFQKPLFDKNIKVDKIDNKEQLVSLNDYDSIYDGFIPYHESLFVLPVLYMNNIKGSLPNIYLRESIVSSLLEHIKLLPSGYSIKIYDGYRTLECEKNLYKTIYQEQLPIEEDKLEFKKSKKEIAEYVKKIVMPEYIPTVTSKSSHLTGGTVNFRICDKNQVDLNYGCLYDEHTSVANINYFEDKLKKGKYLDDYQLEAMLNRRVTINLFNQPINSKIDNKLYFNFYLSELEPSDNYNCSNEFYDNCEDSNIKPNPNYTILDYIKRGEK